MTVRELIEKLEKLPPSSKVLLPESDNCNGYMPYEGEPIASEYNPVVFL